MAVITGTSAGEPLSGTAGNDTITGAGGADTITMLGGNDLALWSLGDGSDIVEGGTGVDTARFTSGNGVFGVSASGSGKVFVAAGVGGGAEIVTLNDVEQLDLRAAAFYNTVTVGDLSGSDVTKVTVDFAGANDFVAAHASSANNSLTVTAAGTTINIAGLPTLFSVTHADASDFVELHGANGNDKLSGATLGAGRIHLGLYGDDGNDSLTGSVNDDGLDGGTGNDTVIGGRGSDTISLGAGNDLFLWTAGDASDTVHGEADVDTVRMTGSNDNEGFSAFAAGGGVHLTRFLGISPSILQLDGIERIEIRTLGGFDSVSVSSMAGTGVAAIAIDLAATAGGKTADTKVDTVSIGAHSTDDAYTVALLGGKIAIGGLGGDVTIDHAGKTDVLSITGGLGNDLIDASALPAGKITLDLLGNSADDTIIGSAGDDKVLEAGGNDQLFLGAGNDVVDWNGSAGDDLIEGGAGIDTFLLSAIDEYFTIGANGGRTLLTRSDGASIDMDDVERIRFSASSTAASFRIDDLAGTGIQQVAIDLSDSLGKSSNGQSDGIGINGTAGNDTIGATIAGNVVTVTGLAAQVTVMRGDHADGLIVDGLAGNDLINMSKLPATSLIANLRGAAGNDTLVGGLGSDLLFGQEDNDLVIGEDGDDQVDLGTGNDLFIWNNGDGNDNVSGGGDFDTLRWTGAVGDEAIKIAPFSANTFQLTRNVGAVTFTGGFFERLEIATLGGADTVEVGNLALAGVTQVAIDLATTAGGKTADTKIDKVSIEGTGGNDEVELNLAGSKIVATGLPTEVSIDHFGKTDRLVIHAGNGHDTIHANTIPAGKISLQLFGDDGADLIFGSANGDIVEGGTGDDTVALGVGSDVYNWFEFDGNDLVVDQGGTDTFRVFGNSSEQSFDLANVGGKLFLASAVDAGSVELDNVERVEILLASGMDIVAIHDLGGSDAKLVTVDLGAGVGPAGDGQADILSIDGTGGNDAITATLVAGAVSIKGLPSQVSASHADAADTIVISGFDGNDTITASALAAKSGHLLLDGGIGNDKISAGGGDDQLFGAAGNDNLTGDSGNDTITGGAGNDTVTGGAGSDLLRYTSVLDGHDVVIGFDGNPTGGQDVLDLDTLFDNLGVAAGSRTARVQILDKGASVEIAVDTDGNLDFDLAVATLKTADLITVGPDIFVGT